ncbi:hypothetical protein N9515_02670 [Vicingaceae bacterium]|nr:hypothetical protein [Vicingaceae bacterium]MDB4060846.1 hypothetical protein [Vicingaceae bacterium]
MKSVKLVFRFTLIVAFLMLITGNVFAGPLDSLELTGVIYNNKTKVKDVVVNIYDHNKLIKKIDVRASNRFVTNLPLNTVLTIEITAPNFHAKRFVIDSKVTSKLRKSQIKYDFDIDIFREDELANVNTSYLDFPVGLVSFDSKRESFHRNKKYTNRMKKAYLKLWAESQAADRQGEGLK